MITALAWHTKTYLQVRIINTKPLIQKMLLQLCIQVVQLAPQKVLCLHIETSYIRFGCFILWDICDINMKASTFCFSVGSLFVPLEYCLNYFQWVNFFEDVHL